LQDLTTLRNKRRKRKRGKFPALLGAMNLLQSKFEILEIEFIAKDGTISKQVEKCLTFTIIA